MGTRFNITGNSANYEVAPGQVATLDMEKAFPGVLTRAKGNPIREAVIFALKTALRNATAGKMETAADIVEAFKAVKTRCAALEAGTWAAQRAGGGGESRESGLARALAVVMETTVVEAIAFIDDMVAKALEENGLDAEANDDSLSEEEKTKKAQITRAVKKAISDDPGVAVKLATIKAEDLISKQAAIEEANRGKVSKFAKA